MIKTINIIIVDDEKIIRAGLASLLRNTEIKIIGEAENGEELFPLIKLRKPDVILLDLEMPKLNGSKTLNRLRAEYPLLKVVILSKYHDEELIKDIFNRGARGFVSKSNCDVETLVTAIRRVSEYGTYKDNIPCLLKSPAYKDGHYYRLILSPREIGIMGLLYQSKSYEEIGKELFISSNTVENHAKSIYKKIKAKNRSEFGIVATRLGLNYIGGEY
ncbi:MAG: response regulator transcription factor [Sphingobacteriaceae bacterium]|nr:response regulator transcription factor [Sphingobacteriaceae bacterium]